MKYSAMLLTLGIATAVMAADAVKPQLTVMRFAVRPTIKGRGWIQVEGGKKEEIRAGDVIWTPPNAKHWHGAQPGSAMSHYAIVEPLNGSSAEWMEKASDEQYEPKDVTTCKTPKT